MSTELTVVNEAPQRPSALQVQAGQNWMEPVTVDTWVDRVNRMKAAMKRCMVESQHDEENLHCIEVKQFWPNVSLDRVSGCWIWNGYRDRKGYGILTLGGRKGKCVRVHRWSFERFVKPIPLGLTIDHLCKNKACVNLHHLEPVAVAENNRRSNNMGVPNARKTACPRGHPYLLHNTYVDYRGRRRCRTCEKTAHRLKRRRLVSQKGVRV